MLTNFYTQQELEAGQTLLITKPLHWTSFNVIAKLRYLFKVKKIGHAGTLDPLATGLLIVCTGKHTKRIQEYMGMPKVYEGTITLGHTTPTYDLESNPEHPMPWQHLNADHLAAAAASFVGTIQQIPPAHSAIKQQGERVYEKARRGETVVMEPRTVTISRFEVQSHNMPAVDFTVACSTGTYIRSLAHDYGALLGCGGYLSRLVRTQIGDYDVQGAWTIEALEATVQKMKEEGRFFTPKS